MLDSQTWSIIDLPAAQPPRLAVIVDTEEEFDWHHPLSRASIGVGHIRDQSHAQAIYARFGLRPTYVVDYAVANQEDGYGPLRDWAEAGACEIGAHLHPWVNPPFDEPVTNRNSYPGNLPAPLERQKLTVLTEVIEKRFGRRPTVYRAGRYGVGPASAAILEDLGYEIDMSVVPRSDFRVDEGPDFRHCGPRPYWFGRSHRLLEIPLTVGWTGLLAAAGAPLQHAAQSRWGRSLRLQGLLSRSHLFDRIRLSPEGITLTEMQRLTRVMIARGQRIFSLTYHSPSLVPGNTPYVANQSDLAAFLKTIEMYLEFFYDEIGGTAATPHEIRSLCASISPVSSITCHPAEATSG